jgi:hypothetical protein
LEVNELDLGVEQEGWPEVRRAWLEVVEEKEKQVGNFTYNVYQVTVTTCTASQTQSYVS